MELIRLMKNALPRTLLSNTQKKLFIPFAVCEKVAQGKSISMMPTFAVNLGKSTRASFAEYAVQIVNHVIQYGFREIQR